MLDFTLSKTAVFESPIRGSLFEAVGYQVTVLQVAESFVMTVRVSQLI